MSQKSNYKGYSVVYDRTFLTLLDSQSKKNCIYS